MSNTLEQRTAQVLDRMEAALDKMGDFPKVEDRIKAVEKVCGELNGAPKLDHAKVREELDSLKATQEAHAKAIKNHRDGFYVSGMEDETFRLDLIALGWNKAKGAKHGYEAVGAHKEFELLRQSWDAAVKRYGSEKLKASGITTGNSESAANFIPDQVLAEIIPALYRNSVFINLTGDSVKGQTRVRVIDGLIGGEAKINGFDGGFVPYWIGAGEDIPLSKFKTKERKLAPRKLGMLASIDEDLYLLGGSGLDPLMRSDMIERGSDELDSVIAFGTGGAQPLGICKTPGVTFFNAQAKTFHTVGTDPAGLNSGDWQGGELNYDRLDDIDTNMAEAKVRPNASFATISGRRYFSYLKQLKTENYSTQTTGQPYLLGMPMLTKAKLAELIGDHADSTHEFFLKGKPGASIGAPSATGTSNYSTVIRGNMSEVLVGRWQGVEMTDDDGKGVGFASGSVRVRFVLRCDVLVREVKAVRFCPDAKVA